MGFKDFVAQQQGIGLLQRSLERRRLAHAYLFSGHELGQLEALARTLAKTLNCQNPVRCEGAAIDCCDHCPPCGKIEHGNHADVHWIRPESKTRIITVEQMRGLMREIQLKSNEAQYKVAIVVAADRLRTEAANAFLKTLEEPPDRSVLVLLTSEPQRLLETILSRCLRLNFGGDPLGGSPPEYASWLAEFSELAAVEQKSLLGRYRLMDGLLRKLTEMKTAIQSALEAKSPLQQYGDAEKEVMDKWEAELSAAVEAEYRRQRSDLLGLLHYWLRDIWVLTLAGTGAMHSKSGTGDGLLNFPDLRASQKVAGRLSTADATANLQVLEQLQRWLSTNVQEALALEVSLLKLRL